MYVWGMLWIPPTDSFVVERPKTDIFAPSGGWNERIDPKSPWQKETIQQAPKPSYQDDSGLKNRFGVELAKVSNPLDAASKIFPDDNSKALWISFNWLNDPVVIAARDIYLKTVELSSPPLDREQLASKVLALAEEKILSHKLGCLIPVAEAKDRIAALKLYSDILGYTGKVEIDQSVKNITNNELIIKLVKPEAKEVAKVIDHAPNVKSSEILNKASSLPISLKLVSGVSR